jgi:hypothetical protein
VTRDELIAFVQSYLDNTNPDFIAMMDTFIETAEDNISETVRVPSAHVTTAFNLVPNQPTVIPPTGLLSVISWSLVADGERVFLRQVEPDFIRAAYPSTSLTGVPTRYAFVDNTQFLLGPIPFAAYTCELRYEVKPPSLVANPSGTWLSQNGTSALKWATLCQGYMWMQGDKEVLDKYETQLGISVGQLRTLVEGRRRKDSFRDGEPRLT